VEQLAVALELLGEERAEFVTAGHALFWGSRANRPERSAPSEKARATDSPRQLPADLPDFVGRDEEFSLVRDIVDPANSNARLAVLSGPPGVGKTALAVHSAHRLESWFPEGQLYAALRDVTGTLVDPSDVLAQFLQVLGMEETVLPAGADARGALFRDRVAGRQMLLILDDAGGYRQVEPLLPARDVAVLITSKLPLTGLPGVTSIDLPPLSGPAALELLSRVIGQERVRAKPQAAATLVSTCGGLPLAVRIAGARLAARPRWSLDALNERLADERRRLDELQHADLAVRPRLRLACQGLTPSAARAFALLGRLRVPSFAEWAVTALLGADPAKGAAAVEELLDARLLEALGPDQTGLPRYRFHDITSLYAWERGETEIGRSEWKAVLTGAATAWLVLARQAQDRLHSLWFHRDARDHPADVADQQAVEVAANQPVEWFEAERVALAVVVSACAEAGLAMTAHCLAGCAASFYVLRGYYDDWRQVMSTAQAACQ
jgi:hypothetical protein